MSLWFNFDFYCMGYILSIVYCFISLPSHKVTELYFWLDARMNWLGLWENIEIWNPLAKEMSSEKNMEGPIFGWYLMKQVL